VASGWNNGAINSRLGASWLKWHSWLKHEQVSHSNLLGLANIGQG